MHTKRACQSLSDMVAGEPFDMLRLKRVWMKHRLSCLQD